MKQIYYLSICLFLALMSCQDDSSTEIIESQPVTFTVGSDSRITQEGTFVKGNSIGVFAYDSSKKNFTGKNAKYIYDGTVFNAASLSEAIYVAQGADIDFYVYSPYDPSCTDPQNITHVAGDQSTTEGWIKADFMTATYTDPIKSSVVNLNFSHRFSTLQVKADKSDEVLSASIENVKSTASFNLLTGGCQTSDVTSNLGMYLYKNEGGMKFYRITIPAQSITNTSNFILQQNIDGTSAKLKGTENLILEPGKIHNLYISSKRRISIQDYLPGGTTKGSGEYTLGSSCNLSTSVNKGYEFLGWYENDLLVNTNKNFAFKVVNDRTFNVKYRSYGPWNIKLETVGNPIPASGGSAIIKASVSRDILINGQPVDKDNNGSNVILSMEQKEGFTLSGNTVTATENKSEANREVKVTATVGQGESIVSKAITITQSAHQVVTTYGEWQISISANPTNFGESGGSGMITASAKRSVMYDGIHDHYEEQTPSVASNAEWCSVSGSNFTVKSNPSTSDRTAYITASYEGKSSRVAITQSAHVQVISYVFTIDGTSAVNTGYLTYKYNERNLNIMSTKTVDNNTREIGYEVKSKPDWCGLNGSVLTVEENTSSKPRKGQMILRQLESNKEVVVNILQKGKVNIDVGS